MSNKQAQREPDTQKQPVRFSAQLSTLAERSKEAYQEALEDFRNAQTVGSPNYFMGND
ncbi:MULTISPECIES: hypothetical protein [Brucella]|uniref:hypothetical protein n=1 Tax=Brucella/Ochrobactrum group TaxID=2826938 RepID=UPI0015E7FBEF|nr:MULTISPECIES: hypothetical protein [Brucella]MCI1001068.1 hypothetical protein [Ochrobactrum sp. C6C9]MDX4073155.1 hypothetical protein [Brucella sp. NBRC 113783]